MTRKPPDGRVNIHRSLLLLSLLINVTGFANAQQQQQQQQLSYDGSIPGKVDHGRSTWVDAELSNVDDQQEKPRRILKNEDPLRYSAPSSSDVRAVATLAPDTHRQRGNTVRAPPADGVAKRGQHGPGSLSSRHLPARSLRDWEVADFVLLATVDGSIHAKDRKTGEKKWSRQFERPVVETEYHAAGSSDDVDLSQSSINDNFLWIVEPSQDGALYTYHPHGGMRKLGMTIKQVVEDMAPYSHDDPPVDFVGSKSVTTYTIDAANGTILRSVSPEAVAVYHNSVCRQKRTLEALDDDECPSTSSIVLARTDYVVRVANRLTDRTISTIRYFEWAMNNRDSDLASQHRESEDNRYIFSRHDGTVMAFDHVPDTRGLSPEEAGSAGQHDKFDSPVIQVYDVLRDPHRKGPDTQLHIVPQPKSRITYLEKGTHDAVFVSATEEGSWYAMSEETYPLVTQGAPMCTNYDGIFGEAPADWAAQLQRTRSLSGVHLLKEGTPANTPAYLGALTIDQPEDQPLELPPGDNETARIDPPKTLLSTLQGPIFSAVLLGVLAFASVYGRQFWNNRRFSSENLFKSKDVGPMVVVESPAEDVLVEEAHKSISNDIRKSVSFEESSADGARDEGNDESEPTDVTEVDEKGPKKKARRGMRGGKRVRDKRESKMDLDNPNRVPDDNIPGVEQVGADTVVTPNVVSKSASTVPDLQNLIIHTDKHIGKGSGGTSVFAGTFEGRDVAVKRMLPEYFELAAQEVSLLEQSEEHPNVIRYFCRRQDANFLYIALERCQASLFDLYRDGKGDDAQEEKYAELVKAIRNSPIVVLRQLADGIKYLHRFRIVHRDVKPQNMLIAYPKKNNVGAFPRFVISDFGLCKTLPDDASTVIGTTGNAGTIGWKAPELISQPRENASGSQSSHTKDPSNGDPIQNALNIKRSCDIFSLGCVFFYVLTQGRHPFDDEEGWMALRERNIKTNRYNLASIEMHGPTTIDLIKWMLSPSPEDRPTAPEVLAHPFFWDARDKLEFLSLASDQFDTEPRDGSSVVLEELESHADEIIGCAPGSLSLTGRGQTYSAQHKRSPSNSSTGPNGTYAVALNIPERNFMASLDKKFIDTLGKQRKYNGAKVADLLRALRNKHHHWDDMPDDVKQKVGEVPEGYLQYWEQRFPALVVGVWRAVKELGIGQERRFSRFFADKVA